MKVRKLIFMCLVTMLLFGICGYSKITVHAETSGAYSYDILYDNTVKITKYIGTETSVIVPSKLAGRTVTEIGNSAFENCGSLVTVKIPNSIIRIGESAFSDCKNLVDITLPNGINQINDCMFYGCISLVKLNIPNGVIRIGDAAFRGCQSITNINLPSSVVNIGVSAFYECESLLSISIPNKVSIINESTFGYCGALKTINISNNIRNIRQKAFSCCSNLSYVNYKGTLKQWDDIAIDNYINDWLLDSTIYCTDGGINNSSVISSVKVSQKSVNATWSKVGGTTGYEVQIATDSKFKKDKKNATTSKQSIIFKNLKANKKYYVRVRSYKKQQVGNQNTIIRSVWSEVKTAKTPVQKPNKTKIKSLKSGKGLVKVSWSKISKVKGYQIELSTDSELRYTKRVVNIKKQKTTSTTIKKYYVHIRTYNVQKVDGKSKKVYSNWSKVKTVTTK